MENSTAFKIKPQATTITTIETEESYPIPEIPETKFRFEPLMTYDGQTRNGIFHGNGTLSLPDQKMVLEGYFSNGDFTDGSINYDNGSSYSGQFVN